MSGELAFALRGVGLALGGSFALREVSFELPAGYVMGLIGANGAGKTTVIRCLLGMCPIDTGEIELLGHRVPGPVELRQDIGVVALLPARVQSVPFGGRSLVTVLTLSWGCSSSGSRSGFPCSSGSATAGSACCAPSCRWR
jgi:ABC-type Mn2+/Zn2+ transport system ATPase subunit